MPKTPSHSSPAYVVARVRALLRKELPRQTAMQNTENKVACRCCGTFFAYPALPAKHTRREYSRWEAGRFCSKGCKNDFSWGDYEPGYEPPSMAELFASGE